MAAKLARKRFGELESVRCRGSVELEGDDLRALADLGVTRTYRKHTVIASEGDETDAFHVVLSGRVKVFVSDENGREIVVATHGPGDYFGEIVLDEGPRCASVITLEASKIAVVARCKLTAFLSEHPRVALRVIQKLVRHLSALTQKVKTLGLMSVSGRVMRLLVELSIIEGGATVIERMTQQDIANRVGASREMISKVLKELVCQGYIRVEKTHITLLRQPPFGA